MRTKVTAWLLLGANIVLLYVATALFLTAFGFAFTSGDNPFGRDATLDRAANVAEGLCLVAVALASWLGLRSRLIFAKQTAVRAIALFSANAIAVLAFSCGMIFLRLEWAGALSNIFDGDGI